MKSKKTHNLMSSRASQALLESTDTFSSRQIDSNSSGGESRICIDGTNKYDSQRRTNSIGFLKYYIKPILTIIGFILTIGVILTFLVILDLYLLKSENQDNNTEYSINDNLNSTENSIEYKKLSDFKWDHCGQTYAKPSIDPKNLFRKHAKRIVGGEDAVKHSWPFLVSVRLKNNKSEHHCGGTLITDEHVITAAHCFIVYFKLLKELNLDVSQIFSLVEVHVGLNTHENSPDYLTSDHVYPVEYFDIHEDFTFSQWTLVHDIAIVKLKRKVNLNRPEVNVICLPSMNNSIYKVSKDENVVAIGWGTYAEEFNYTAYIRDHLQQAVFTIRDKHYEMCNSGMIGKEWNKNYTVCADGRDKKIVTCYGDSGGPVLAYRNNRWTLFGIISFGHDVRDEKTNKKKCNASMPFYFVKVKAYFDWINKKTNYTLRNFQ